MTEPTEQRYLTSELGEMMEVESLCPACEENGTTRLMITNIPHFRQIIVSSFECPHCHERNNEVQFGGEFGPKHVFYELTVRKKKDLDRQIVKSEFATIKFNELDLEIPPQTQKGVLNTVEGVLTKTIEELQVQQQVRKALTPEVYQKIEDICRKIEGYLTGETEFTVTLGDPAGNSYIEAYHDHYHPTIDNQLTKIERDRTDIDHQLLGLSIDYNSARTQKVEQEVEEGQVGEEIIQLETTCSACSKPGKINIHQVDIPYFKETMIMAFKCEYCGYKSNEIKTGGGIPAKGLRLTLRVLTKEDLNRDVLKSHSAALMIPELDLELTTGTLGGFFSTVEGCIYQIHEQLESLPQAHFATGDSASVNTNQNGGSMKEFTDRLLGVLEVKEPFTLILDDPLAASYIQNPREHLPPPENIDPQLQKEEYERTSEQNEELGLNQMQAD